MFNKTLKFIVILVIGLSVAFFAIRYYVNNGGKREIATETAEYRISAKVIAAQFSSNTAVSNKKYLDKSIVISGRVTSVSGTDVIIDNLVNCSFLTSSVAIKKEQQVTIKGRVVGYDDLMGEVKMDQCSLSN